jgi:superfamily II DNA or RNA helicase
MTNPYQDCQPSIFDNPRLRTPQREAYKALSDFANNPDETDREVGIILPVGCGKSGCITLAPFAFRARRALVIAPNLAIAQQLVNDFDPARQGMFYKKCGVLSGAASGQPYPELVEIRGTTANRSDLDEAHVVVTNIHQLQGEDNRWLLTLPDDFFDVILFDEGHHAVANSWNILKAKFPNAKIINFSATPFRSDGQTMAGKFIYSYPVYRAIQEGYVKRLKAIVLNPRSLKYVRREDGQEIEVSLDEVRQLGEQDADFRRSIVTSTETLNTIVDVSIRQLQKRREITRDNRLKIIASALNYEHCRQIVEAYRARGQRADYVHSREDQPANQRVMQRLENHELDVIVQVRKLGEGFDHPCLTVAAVFSIFSNLSPFIQFVGRIMRVIEHEAPGHVLNQGIVVFHAGANVARRWSDFQDYSEADREFFDQFLPVEGVDPATEPDEREIEPALPEDRDQLEVRSQLEVRVQEIPLLREHADAMKMIEALRDWGYSQDDVSEVFEMLDAVPTTKQRERQAMRGSLDMRIRTEAGRILNRRGINQEGRELDRQHLQRSNFIVLKSSIDRHVNALVGRSPGQRHDFTRPELDQVNQEFEQIIARAVEEVFNVER